MIILLGIARNAPNKFDWLLKMETKKMFKRIIIMSIPILVSFLFLFWAWIWNSLGMKILCYIHLVGAIIVAMDYPATIICHKLDDRFDRLEEILKEKDKKEESKKDKDKYEDKE